MPEPDLLIRPARTDDIAQITAIYAQAVNEGTASFELTAPDEAALVALDLVVPTTIDLVPEFHVLLEAGSLDGPAFIPTHRARRLLKFRFDRSYPAWVRLVQGRA